MCSNVLKAESDFCFLFVESDFFSRFLMQLSLWKRTLRKRNLIFFYCGFFFQNLDAALLVEAHPENAESDFFSIVDFFFSDS